MPSTTRTLPSVRLSFLILRSEEISILIKILFVYIFILSGAENPTYLKQGTEDKVTTGLAIGGLALGILCIGRGLYNMANGINKVA